MYFKYYLSSIPNKTKPTTVAESQKPKQIIQQTRRQSKSLTSASP